MSACNDCLPQGDVALRWKWKIKELQTKLEILTFHGQLILKFQFHIRELKQGWWRQQQECHKTIDLMVKSNRPAHVLYVFVHFLPSSAKQQHEITKFKVLWRTWTHNSEFFILLCYSTWTQFSSWIHVLCAHCASWTNWKNCKVMEVTQSYIFKWCSYCRN